MLGEPSQMAVPVAIIYSFMFAFVETSVLTLLKYIGGFENIKLIKSFIILWLIQGCITYDLYKMVVK